MTRTAVAVAAGGKSAQAADGQATARARRPACDAAIHGGNQVLIAVRSRRVGPAHPRPAADCEGGRPVGLPAGPDRRHEGDCDRSRMSAATEELLESDRGGSRRRGVIAERSPRWWSSPPPTRARRVGDQRCTRPRPLVGHRHRPHRVKVPASCTDRPGRDRTTFKPNMLQHNREPRAGGWRGADLAAARPGRLCRRELPSRRDQLTATLAGRRDEQVPALEQAKSRSTGRALDLAS